MDVREKIGLITIFVICLIVFIAVGLISPIAQDPGYHLFADRRTIFSVPNFCDVISNILLLIIGLMGTKQLFQGRLQIIEEFKHAYIIFFVSVGFVAFGSVYYHLWPNNQTLVWDRLPMTIAFMSLISIIMAEFVCTKVAKILFWPLVLLGAVSVIYWIWTEKMGQGDLRLYGLVQFVPMIIMPIILLCFKSKFSPISGYWWLLLCYLIAKLLEHFDGQVFSVLGIISGHTLKHLVAALGLWILLKNYQRRCDRFQQ